MNKRLSPIGVAAALLMTGCAGTFSDHNENIREGYQAFKIGNFNRSIKSWKEDRGNKLDGLCYTFDTAMVQHVAGDYKGSISSYAAAKRRMGGFDDRAKVSASDIAETAGSFLVNEKTIPYKGEDFERILLPAFQARNYFQLGDKEGAAIEARRCIFQQKLVRKKNDLELGRAKKESAKQSKKKKVNSSSYFAKISKAGRVNKKYLSSPQNLYQIAYVNYLTATFLEANGDINNAAVFMRKAYEVLPNSRVILRDLARLTDLNGSTEEAAKMSKKLGEPLPARDAGSIIVFFDCGEAPKKFEQSIVFGAGGVLAKMALPVYRAMPNSVSGLEVEVDGQAYRTEELSSIEQIAFRYFHDRLPLITAKMIVRVVGKITAQVVANQLARRTHILVRIGVLLTGWIWAIASEQADLRAWRTLPQNLQATRLYLPPGEHRVKIRLLGRGGGTMSTKDLGVVNVKPGSLESINVRSIGSNFFGSASPGLVLKQGS